MDGERCRRKAFLDKASGDEAKYVVKIAVPMNGWRPLTKEKRYSTEASGDVMKYVLSVTPEWVATADEGECYATKRKYVVKYSEAQ
jgi:hypothetical protein